MTFSFNFQVDPTDPVTNAKTTIQNENDEQKKVDTVLWKEAKEHFVEERHRSKVTISNVQNFDQFKLGEDTSLSILNSDSITFRLRTEEYSGDLEPALLDNTDLVPGKYEGGLKIWECSEDLVRYLHDSDYQFSDKRVLELGCGAGLPGLLALSQGAEVMFSDYNEDVLTELTIPNALLNLPSRTQGVFKVPAKPDSTSDAAKPVEEKNCRFLSGDWSDLEKNFLAKENKKFDLILTSETIYNVDNQSKLVSIFQKFLKDDGHVLVAGKTLYFGVGGGMRQFETLVKQSGLECETVKTCDTGVKREILKISKRSNKKEESD